MTAEESSSLERTSLPILERGLASASVSSTHPSSLCEREEESRALLSIRALSVSILALSVAWYTISPTRDIFRRKDERACATTHTACDGSRRHVVVMSCVELK